MDAIGVRSAKLRQRAVRLQEEKQRESMEREVSNAVIRCKYCLLIGQQFSILSSYWSGEERQGEAEGEGADSQASTRS